MIIHERLKFVGRLYHFISAATIGEMASTEDAVPTKKNAFGKVSTDLIPLELNKKNAILVGIVNALGVLGLFTFIICGGKLKTFIISYLYGALGGFGVTAGAHRLWTHRSYKATTPFRIILALGYVISGQNTIIHWVRDHRLHHRYSETNADPHNSTRGFLFSHVGWLTHKRHPECVREGKKIDLSDLYEDPVVMHFTKYYTIYFLLLSVLIPTLIPIYLLGESLTISISINLLRYVYFLNGTWLVNSAAHIWGYRPYSKFIAPAENIFVGVMCYGEGWHNYHHIFPWDYRASEIKPVLMNLTTVLLDAAAKIGWVYDRKYPSKELVDKIAKRYGDGSYEGHLPEVQESGEVRTEFDSFLAEQVKSL